MRKKKTIADTGDYLWSGNSVSFCRQIKFTNALKKPLNIYVKFGKANYPVQFQFGGKKPEGWEELKEMKFGDMMNFPLSTTLIFD